MPFRAIMDFDLFVERGSLPEVEGYVNSEKVKIM
jgi:hypothetical protein